MYVNVGLGGGVQFGGMERVGVRSSSDDEVSLTLEKLALQIEKLAAHIPLFQHVHNNMYM